MNLPQALCRLREEALTFENGARVTDVESLLPEEIRRKAVRSGRELAWRRENVFEALQAAHAMGLASVGGQVQFVFPDGTCELYWLNFDPRGRQPEEGWREYAQRTYDETAAALRRLLETIDITTEGLNSFDFLRAKARDGANLLAHMVFVCYFVASDAPNT